jgi:hypothetical protein
VKRLTIWGKSKKDIDTTKGGSEKRGGREAGMRGSMEAWGQGEMVLYTQGISNCRNDGKIIHCPQGIS